MLKVKREEGQALVELALSLTALIFMLVGSVEFGELAFSAIAVVNSAKAAAQYASQSSTAAVDLAGIRQVAQNEYPTPASLTLVSPTAASGYACTCAGTGTSAVCTNNSITSPSCPGSYMEVTVTVQTRVSVTPVIPTRIIWSLPAWGTASQKVLQ